MRNLLLVALSLLLSGQLKATCATEDLEEEMVWHTRCKLNNGLYLERTPDCIVCSSRKSFHVEDFSFLLEGAIGKKLLFTTKSLKDGDIPNKTFVLTHDMSLEEFSEVVRQINSHVILQVYNNDKNDRTCGNLFPVVKFLEWLNWWGYKED